MTPKEQQLLCYIEAYAEQHGGVGPTFREMCVAMELASMSGIARMADSLERQGRITRDRRRARGLRVIPAAPDLRGVTDAALLAEAAQRGLLERRL